MAEKPDFIEGIYNYCDYLCEKCINTARCHLYWSEQHPRKARIEFNKAAAKMDEMIGEIEVPEDWQIPPGVKAREEQLKALCKKRVIPANKLGQLAHKMLKSIDDCYWKTGNREQRNALDNISINHFLISAKLHRALHDVPESIDAKPGECFYGYDSENTLLALRGFLWNFLSGCRELPKFFPEHKSTCEKLHKLARGLLYSIENEYLPMVKALEKYDNI